MSRTYNPGFLFLGFCRLSCVQSQLGWQHPSNVSFLALSHTKSVDIGCNILEGGSDDVVTIYLQASALLYLWSRQGWIWFNHCYRFPHRNSLEGGSDDVDTIYLQASALLYLRSRHGWIWFNHCYRFPHRGFLVSSSGQLQGFCCSWQRMTSKLKVQWLSRIKICFM